MRWPPTPRALIVAAILAAALAIRVAEVQLNSYAPVNDAGAYLSLASQIAHIGDYSTSRGHVGAGGTIGPSAYFPPGLPYLLAASDLISGHTARRDGAINPARLAQAVVGTAVVGLIGLVALEGFGEGVAFAALALAAVYPVLIELSTIVVAENLLTALALAAIWAMLRASRAKRAYRWIAAAGVLTGLATLAHENGILLLLPLGAAVWGLGRTRGLGRAKPLAVLIATTALAIAPWTIRNAVLLHRFIPVSDETGITLVGAYNGASAAYPRVPYKWRIYFKIPGERKLVRQAPGLTEPTLGDRLQSQAVHYIGDHPFSPFVVAFHNTLRLFEVEGSYAWHASALAQGLKPSRAWVGVVSFWVVCALALCGAFTRAARRAPRWLWVAPLLFALSVVLINVETPRFRAPVEPFLVLLAACALATAVGRVAARARLGRTPVRSEAGPLVTAHAAQLVQVV